MWPLMYIDDVDITVLLPLSSVMMMLVFNLNDIMMNLIISNVSKKQYNTHCEMTYKKVKMHYQTKKYMK